MSFEEEFDKIIRRKAEEEKYPFDERNWGKANQLLDAERVAVRTAKFKKLYLPTALIIALGSIGLFTFNYLNKEDKKELAQEVTLANALKNKSTKEQIIAASNLKAQKSSEVLSKNELSQNKSETLQGNEQSEISMRKISAASEKNNAKVNPVLNESDAGSENNIEKNIESISANADVVTNSPSVIEAGNTDGNIPAATSYIVEEPVRDCVLKLKDEEEVESIIAPPVFDEQSIEQLTVDKLSAVYSTFPFQLTDGNLIQTPFVFLKRYEDDYFKSGRTKNHYFNVEIGTNYLLGWDTKNGKDGVGFNWFGGFNYGRYISNKMSVSIGLQAYNVSNIKQPFYIVSNKAYDFGSTDVYTRVSSNQLYFVSVPLKFNYALNTSNTIGFGVNAGYLVNAKNSVSKYYVLDNEEKMINPVTTNKEIYKGTSMTNIILSAHYKTKLNDRFALNAEFNYGVTDLFKNMGEIRNIEKPMGIRVSVSYTLFDK